MIADFSLSDPNTFTTFELPSTFNGLTSAQFQGIGNSALNGNQFSVDNIEVSTSAVPEPSTLILLSVGLLGAIGMTLRPNGKRKRGWQQVCPERFEEHVG